MAPGRLTRSRPDQLWKTDIAEHPTRESKAYCHGREHLAENVVWNQHGLRYNGHFPLDLVVVPASDMP